MTDEPTNPSPRRRPRWVGWLAGLAGVALLNLAADLWARGNSVTLAVTVGLTALASLTFALWWARGLGPA